ncbi:MAG: hypothetical protein JWM64_2015 [Frankiales bacterium]|nr:hypothetical protein [Frankiales bacterium]
MTGQPDGAPLTVTLLDEELAVLVPGAGPLPHLDTLDAAAADAVLRSTARGLLVRGLALPHDDGLVPAAGLAGLLHPLGRPGPLLQVEVHGTGVLTVVRPAADGELLVHDVSADGVHVLTLLPAGELVQQVVRAVEEGAETQLRLHGTGAPPEEATLQGAAVAAAVVPRLVGHLVRRSEATPR